MKKILPILTFLFFTNFCLAQNYGLEFDAVDDKLTLCHSDDFNVGDGFTIEAWIYAYNWRPEIWRGSIANKDEHPGTGFALRAGNNGSLSFVLGSTAGWPEIATGPLMNANQWYHVAGVVNGTTMELYINGELEASGTYSGTLADNIVPLTLGWSPGYGDRGWDGIIDDVRIWQEARTALQLTQNMAATFTGNEANLVAYLPMNEGATLTTENLAGCNANFGGMTEAAWVDGFSIPSTDLGVTEIVSPDVLSIYERPVKVRVAIKNFGNEPIANFPVVLEVNGQVLATQTYFGALQPDQTAPFTFEDPVDLTGNATNEMIVRTEFVDDGNLLNNAVTVNYLPADGGTKLNIFDGAQHNFGNEGQTQYANVVMPYHMEDFEQILLHIQVDCPGSGCDPWDQPASFYVDTPDGNFEIARYITPYGIACGPWTVDVTDFKSILKGPITFRSYVQVWGTSGWLVSADLEFVKGTAPNYQHISKLWESSNWVYGDPGIDDNLEEQTLNVNSVTQSGHMRMTISGHGQGNTDNAAEFSNKTHTVVVNGANAANHNLWKADCEFNSCADQAGNWLFDRAGWCPGQHVEPYIYNLSGDLTPNGSISLDYELEDYTNLLNTGYNSGSHTEPHYRLYAYMVEQSSQHFETLKNLRAEEVVVETNGDPNNPVFESVTFKIKNTGSEDAPSSFVSYYVNGNFVVQENINENILAGGEYTHSFTMVDGFVGGTNNVIAVVSTFGDQNFSDDAIGSTVQLSTNTDELELGNFTISPNPSKGEFIVELSEQFLQGTLSIMDVQGRILKEQTISQTTFSFNQKAKGLYFVAVRTVDGSILLKKVLVH